MLTDRAGLPADERNRLENEVSAHAMLEDVVRAGRPIVEVVVQDEFAHDVVVTLREPLHLVYSTT